MKVILKIDEKSITAIWCDEMHELQTEMRICKNSKLHKIPGDKYFATTMNDLLNEVNKIELCKAK